MALLVFCMKKHYHKTVKIKMMSLLVVTTPELGRVFSYVYCFSAHKVIAYKSCLEHIMASTDLYRLFFLRLIAQFFTQIYMNCFVSS